MTRCAVELHEEVAAWLGALDEPDWHRMVVVIDRLADLGPAARMPLSRSLGGGLFELRVHLAGVARRVTYRFTADGRLILLTTFQKQRQRERVEIDRARRVAAECARCNP